MKTFLNGRVMLHAGDCLTVLPTLPECSVDAVCTDPPYHLASIVKRFTTVSELDVEVAQKTPHRRASSGFMGKAWDGGEIAFRPETWAAVLRVLKPGGHMVAFAAPKNAHRMVCAIEDAGFEIRDTLMWLYGSGFPKSLDVSKAIDKAAGAERERLSAGRPVKRMIPGADQHKAGWEKTNGREYVPGVTAPATDAARAWEGFGTALKPAFEQIVLARKPLSETTIAANVLKHGTGALNIGACRVGVEWASDPNARGWQGGNSTHAGAVDFGAGGKTRVAQQNNAGRWPANVLLSWPEDEYQLRRDVTHEQKRELYRWLSANA